MRRQILGRRPLGTTRYHRGPGGAARLLPLRGRGRSSRADRLGGMSLVINATEIMLVVVVPVVIATLGFAWWYRSSNLRAAGRALLHLPSRCHRRAEIRTEPSRRDTGLGPSGR